MILTVLNDPDDDLLTILHGIHDDSLLILDVTDEEFTLNVKSQNILQNSNVLQMTM
jgi:hypothetical protein